MKFLPCFLLLTAAVLAGCVLAGEAAPQKVEASSLKVKGVQAFLRVPKMAVYAGEAQAASAPEADIPLPDGPGKDITVKTCGMCHTTNTFASKRHTREEWVAVLETMTTRGMEEPSETDSKKIVDYLTASFPPAPKP